ncbi:MAG: fibronectin type III domain-containing protein [Flavobacteriales bacterium]|nr:fibronectin type III domain-containing protein [Flavobacteriales bacterium]
MANKIVIGVRGLNAAQLVDKARYVVDRMTGNAVYPDPTPKLSDVTIARQALESAITAAMDGGRTAIAIRRARQRDLKLLLEQLAGYVVSLAGDNDLAILSSGFGVKRTGRPVGEVPAPVNLQASMNPLKGRVDLRWNPVRHALTYTVYVNSTAPEQEAAWKQAGVSAKASFKVTGLESGKLHWFRVSAYATAGMGPLSDMAASLAS